MSGATGLYYPSLYPLLDRLCPDAEAWDALFEDIRVMEIAALEIMHDH